MAHLPPACRNCTLYASGCHARHDWQCPRIETNDQSPDESHLRVGALVDLVTQDGRHCQATLYRRAPCEICEANTVHIVTAALTVMSPTDDAMETRTELNSECYICGNNRDGLVNQRWNVLFPAPKEIA